MPDRIHVERRSASMPAGTGGDWSSSRSSPGWPSLCLGSGPFGGSAGLGTFFDLAWAAARLWLWRLEVGSFVSAIGGLKILGSGDGAGGGGGGPDGRQLALRRWRQTGS